MPLLLVGAEREALPARGEQYKAAARHYLETSGYAETIDASIEGTLADMILVSAGSLFLPQARVETKDTDLSLSDEAFRHEVRSHLQTWLRVPRSARFDLYVFARRLKNQARWKEIFEDQAPDEIRRWLLYDVEDARLLDLLEANWSRVLEFFSRVYVVQGSLEDLERASQEKEEISLGSPSRWAEELKRRLDRRISVDPTPDTLVANLTLIRHRRSFRRIEINTDFEEDVWQAIHPAPPLVMIAKRTILTFDSPSIIEALTPLRTGETNLVSVETVEDEYPAALMELIHQYVIRVALARGAVYSGKLLFFPLQKVGDSFTSFSVTGAKGRPVSLADPLFVQMNESEKPEGLVTATHAPQLNFGVHTGFKTHIQDAWGARYLSFIQHRVFTLDGRTRHDPEVSRRIDKSFRDPTFNRSSTVLTKLQAAVGYIFGDSENWPGGSCPGWLDVLNLAFPTPEESEERIAGALVRLRTPSRPVEEAMGEPTLWEYEERDDAES